MYLYLFGYQREINVYLSTCTVLVDILLVLSYVVVHWVQLPLK
jgi:hypothetical protein